MKKRELQEQIRALEIKNTNLTTSLEEAERSRGVLQLLANLRPNCDLDKTHWKLDIGADGQAVLTIRVWGQASLTLADGDSLAIRLPVLGTKS